MPMLVNTFYKTNGALILCTNLTKQSINGVVVSMDCLTIDRVYNDNAVTLSELLATDELTNAVPESEILGSPVATMRLDNEWVGITFDASILVTKSELFNKNQALITITSKGAKYSDGPPLNNYPQQLDYTGTTKWKKDNTLGLGGFITLSPSIVFEYDSVDYHNYGNGEIVLNINLGINQFSNNVDWVKNILFKDMTQFDTIKSDHVITVNVIGKDDKVIASPYQVNAGDKMVLKIPVSKTENTKVLRFSCYGNNVIIG